MSVQNYETDILQEHVDSTPILINRLEQWRQGLQAVENYINGYLQIHQGIASNVDKTLKQISEVQTFSGSEPSEAGPQSSLGSVFDALKSNVNVLLQRSNATVEEIQNSVRPPLESAASDIEKHYKSLKSHGGKGIKEVEKSRGETQKLIEHLGQVTSSFGSRSLSPHDDPYIIHRRIQGALDEQVSRENTQAEAALSVQRSFASLEGTVVQTIRNSLERLSSINEEFDRTESEVNNAITQSFANINLDNEWKSFVNSNRKALVPDSGYQRDPSKVTFVNKDHSSTKPLIEGLLNRKGTVLKSYNESFYSVSAAGYLYQFKNSESSADLSPDLSLYLPDCQVSRSEKPGEFVFKVHGKDCLKTLSTRHKYTFKANSASDADAWYSAISRVIGNVETNEDDSPNEDAHEPPVAQVASTHISEQRSGNTGEVQATTVVTTATPQTGVSQAAGITNSVPQTTFTPTSNTTGVLQSATHPSS